MTEAARDPQDLPQEGETLRDMARRETDKALLMYDAGIATGAEVAAVVASNAAIIREQLRRPGESDEDLNERLQREMERRRRIGRKGGTYGRGGLFDE